MPDSPSEASPPRKIPTWLKTIVGTFAGLLSGAVMMYLSPLLDKFVKPAPPVANFAVDHEGTTVTFYNRSSRGSEGWWDFGDGSPLEPVAPKQDTITHAYANPGSFVAKLTLRNLIGDVSERTVNLQLDGLHADPPEILSLEATPISPGAYAPATFRVVSKAKNARLCIWDFGDDRPFQIDTEMPNSRDQLVSFQKPGGYLVKVAAVNGDQAKEKNTIVFVDEPPDGAITATLHVTDQATRVEKVEAAIPVTVTCPPQQKEKVYSFDEAVPAKPGFEIIAARFEPLSDRNVEGLDLRVASDKRTAHLTGKLVRDTSLFGSSPSSSNVVVRVVLTQEYRVPASRPSVPVTAAVTVPGSMLLPLPSLPDNWINPQRQLRLEMRDGDRILWQDSQLPHKAALNIQDHHYSVTATPVGDQVRLEVVEVHPDYHPVGN